MSKIRPPFKYHGGKYYLCDWIISSFPANYEDMTYVEPYVGGGSVLLNKKKSKYEIVNDIDSNIMSIYTAIQSYEDYFIDRLENIPYCEQSFNKALKKIILYVLFMEILLHRFYSFTNFLTAWPPLTSPKGEDKTPSSHTTFTT